MIKKNAAFLSLSIFLTSMIVGSCAGKHVISKVATARVETLEVGGLQIIGHTEDGKVAHQGGFSGLHFIRRQGDKLYFYTHSDRGPNGEPTKDARPFLFPDYQPQVMEVEVDLALKKATVVKTTPLWKSDGKKITGLPNVVPTKDRPAEMAVTIDGRALGVDPMGVDLEGISVDGSGDVWMVDEYGPSIVRFSKTGTLIERFSPKVHGQGVLPQVYGRRRLNRGFEGVCIRGDKLYAILQSPIVSKTRWIRLLEMNLRQKKIVAEYLYALDRLDVDKIGDLACTGDSTLMVIEQNSEVNQNAVKNIYKVDLTSASNVLEHSQGDSMIESWSPEEMQQKKISPVRKELVVALHEHGLGYVEKFEGLALVQPNMLVVVSDNDFGVTDKGVDPGKKSQLFLIHLH